ncbi:hypothetical protein BB559_000302 [Furculomyces boomerangus]|uniref:Magnesium transporter n=1 Tax=Furculomyces boomerangus TaxID=61424 RepID=A0A2T9Z5U3_9FUNG|nr:hypothetical protein BB559_000302 [Furculomyces boomerangus]
MDPSKVFKTNFKELSNSRIAVLSSKCGSHLGHGFKILPSSKEYIVQANEDQTTLNSGRCTGQFSFADLQPSDKTDNNFNVWIDIVDPTVDEMNFLKDLIGLHQSTVENILKDERGGENYRHSLGYHYFEIKSIATDENIYSEYNTLHNFCSTHFVIKNNILLTVREGSILHYRERALEFISTNVAATPDTDILLPEYISYILADEMVSSLEFMFKSVEAEVDVIDELVLILSKKEKEDVLRRIGKTRRLLHLLLSAIQSKPTVLKNLKREIERHVSTTKQGEEDLSSSQISFLTDNQKHKAISFQGYSTIQNAIFGLRSLSDMSQNLLVSCAHSESILSQSYNYYLGRLLIESDHNRLKFVWYLHKWYQLAVFLTIPGAVYTIIGMNVLVPWDVRPETDFSIGSNSRLLPFSLITVISLLLCLFSYYAHIKRSHYEF